MTNAQRVRESLITYAFFSCAVVSVATTVGIVWVLVFETFGFFRKVSIVEFLFGLRWAPLIEPTSYGALPLLCGTALIAIGALVFAVPVGLAAAIYLSEYAATGIRSVAKPVLEVLAGIPTVVYGYFAVTFITPSLLKRVYPDVEPFNALSAAIVVAIMIVPTICSLSEDAFRAVPRTLRDAAYALSATRFEVSTRVVFPAALSGVTAAILLAFARAIGETMAVALAAGVSPKLTLNPMVSIQTMTSFIAQIAGGDTPAGSIGYLSIFAVGLYLFAITLAINMLAQRILRRFREVYD